MFSKGHKKEQAKIWQKTINWRKLQQTRYLCIKMTEQEEMEPSVIYFKLFQKKKNMDLEKNHLSLNS